LSQKLPRATSSQVIKALEKLDFRFSRQSGSHKIYKNAQGKRVTVPSHKGKVLHPKVLKSILKDADVSLNEFFKLL
jgi:predicted RNA binding protein YcfA (HicA-like mRNA interferase family)